MPFDVTGVDWVTWGIVLAVLAVAWVVLKSVLKLTAKAFTLGCTGLVVLAVIGAALVWLRQ
jgi:hypothetical protein